MLSHIFASAAMESYDAIERSLRENATVIWNGALASPFLTTHWALSDPKAGRPVTLFLPARRRRETLDAEIFNKAAHRAWQVDRLSQIAE